MNNQQRNNIPQFAQQNVLQPPQTGSMDEQINYYQQEACRLYIANVLLTNQVKELINEKNQLQDKVYKLEQKQQNETLSSNNDDKKKRHRRQANEIERHYKCPIEECSKNYGSEGSLAQHIKLKHPDFYNSITNNITQTISKLKQDDEQSQNEGKIESQNNQESANGNN